MSRIVIALGGNALALPKEQVTVASQFKHAEDALKEVVKIAKEGHEIVLTHGNGPQVGAILNRVEAAKGTYTLPLEVCVAESEGELGYMLEQSLYNVLRESHMDTQIASLLTQVVVSQFDDGFEYPSKPIGPFFTEAHPGMKEDAGRGWRRVVASPKPLEIIEAATIRFLLSQKTIVLAAGGGGIPVIRKGARLVGVEAVIDKDYASAVLAQSIGADTLLILTAVPNAYLHFNTPLQQALTKVTIKDAEHYLSEDHFADGSMKPKIEAAVQFVKEDGKRVIITDIAHAYESLHNETIGTHITK